MQAIAEEDVKIRIARDNPWWSQPNIVVPEAQFARRVYFHPFKALSLNFQVHRAVVLLGPRRVGKLL
jgi:hypothetical protein